MCNLFSSVRAISYPFCIANMTLEKYISEVVVAVVDGVLKCKASADVGTAVEVSGL